MNEALSTAQQSGQATSISRVVFIVDRTTGKVISVAPAVNTDEELAQLDPWIQACLMLSDLIKFPKITQTRVAA